MTVKEDMLNAALGEYTDYGFILKEPNDHILEIYFKDKRVAELNQDKASIPIIHECCRNYLRSIARWQSDESILL